MANTDEKEATIKVDLKRSVDSGEKQYGPGEADVPEAFAHRLIAAGDATVVTSEKAKNRALPGTPPAVAEAAAKTSASEQPSRRK